MAETNWSDFGSEFTLYCETTKKPCCFYNFKIVPLPLNMLNGHNIQNDKTQTLNNHKNVEVFTCRPQQWQHRYQSDHNNSIIRLSFFFKDKSAKNWNHSTF